MGVMFVSIHTHNQPNHVLIIDCYLQGEVKINTFLRCKRCTYYIPQNTDTEVSACKAQTVLGVYAMKREGAEPGDELEDVGVLIEREEVISDLGNIGMAFVLLFGLIYCLNLTYPADLKCTFEVVQKILLNLDGQRLSSKAQFLKNKLME